MLEYTDKDQPAPAEAILRHAEASLLDGLRSVRRPVAKVGAILGVPPAEGKWIF